MVDYDEEKIEKIRKKKKKKKKRGIAMNMVSN